MARSYPLTRRIRALGSGATFAVDLVEVEGRLAVEKRVAAQLATSPAADFMLAREAEVLAVLDDGPWPRLLAHQPPSPGGLRRVLESYVEGMSLSRALDDAPDRPTRYRLLVGVCDLVTDLHGAQDRGGAPLGAFHGDLSPENLIVTPSGGVVAVDFGAAGTIALPAFASRGTPPFAPPEVLRGEASASQAVDRYAVAAIAVEWLTTGLVVAGPGARRLGDLPVAARLVAVGDQGVVPPADDDHGTSPLHEALTQALSFTPAKRPRTLDALRTQLHALAGRRASTRPEPG